MKSIIPLFVSILLVLTLIVVIQGCSEDGINGRDGNDGAQGPEGSQGPQGPEGPEGPQGPAGTNDLELVATKVASVSALATMDLDGNSSVWQAAKVLVASTVAAGDNTKRGPDITLQAIYDNDSVAIRSEWADATESVLKNAWRYDGNDTFTKIENEDRFMYAFPIHNIPEFSQIGCTAACHNAADHKDDWWMGTSSANLRYDSWHWKAARTNPINQADDKWWSIQEDPNDVESSRHGDSKDSGGPIQNISEDGKRPVSMHGTDLTDRFIFSGEEVPVDTSGLAVGTVIPGYILSPWVGSRGDIETRGKWENGKWVVVMKRVFNTGNDDDVVLSPPTKALFGVAVMENGSGIEHDRAINPVTLIFGSN